MLNQNRYYYPRVFGGEGNETNPIKLFLGPIKSELKPVRDALQARYDGAKQYPTSATALQRILSDAGIDFAALRDPWGTPYRTSFLLDKQLDALIITTAGADKEFDTSDDFVVERLNWYYFRANGEAVDRAVEEYHKRTRGFIRDQQTLKEELERLGIKLEALVDRWSHAYKLDFPVAGTRFLIAITSAGPNGKFESAFPNDDFTIWTSAIDYFAEPRAQIDGALAAWVRNSNLFPQNETELRAALRAAGLSMDEMRDPWRRSYYALLSAVSFYGDRAKIEARANYGEQPKQQIDIKPVTQRIITVKLRSAGPDLQEGTADDFTVASFSGTVSEQAASEIVPQKVSAVTTFAGSTGAIRGVVLDPNGGVVPGCRVIATRTNTSQTFNTETDDEGIYLLRNLPVGLYSVRLEASGFQSYTVDNVLVHSSNVVEVNASLNVGTVAEVVTITAGNPSVMNTTSANVSSVQRVNHLTLDPRAAQSRAQLATPRLREYFPETLLWQPSLETDSRGRAQINFKLADNITTWKMAVIGSTEDGQLGMVEREIKSFQPFFVEHDPPRILTEGDEISLPVVVRNYLPRAQAVDLDIKAENWFALLGPAHKRTEVAAGDSRRETFDLRAVGSVKDGKQRITATAADDSDAIEKPVTVHPDGEELTATAGDILTERAALDLNLAASVIPNSVQAELKIYPNLMGHVTESVEAIMKRPYGCGEQTISSTYPSLLVLRHYKQTKANAGVAPATAGGSAALRTRAERYLNEGYIRLLNYRDAGGGFTYWGRGYADVALTAYALRFLNDASDLIEVDDEVPAKARAWLLTQQAADGRWSPHLYESEVESKSRTVLLTAYVARVLAATELKGNLTATGVQKNAPVKISDQSVALKRALDYLSRRVDELDEPYLLAVYALASFDAGDARGAADAVAKLRALAHTEGNTTYWSLETNTPFYGWGIAGRVETTALAVQALARSPESSASAEPSNQILTPPTKAKDEASDTRGPIKTSPARQTNDHLVRSGLLFLLKEKDRYGVWYSTQATINVLDAMLLLLQKGSEDKGAPSPSNPQNFAEIIVNGQVVQAVPMPPPDQFGNPIFVDVSRFMKAANNQIEVRRAPNSSPASVQAVVTYYVPWSASSATRDAGTRAGDSDGLRLVAKFDRTEGKVSDEISCHVEAERVGFRGYGMMLAEIGLPPGADVDRASLETAMKSSDWAMSQYDILPDRVLVYLWPRAGGVKFDFKFRPRCGLNARTAPSLIYDYYNPDARAVVAPAKFIVK